MLNTANKVADASRLTAVADASFVIGISLCQQWDTLEMLVEKLIIANTPAFLLSNSHLRY